MHDALSKLFLHHEAGIVIAASKTFAITQTSDHYLLFDSHPCEANGKPAQMLDGRACMAKCSSIASLKDALLRAANGSSDSQVEIFHIDVTALSDFSSGKNFSEQSATLIHVENEKKIATSSSCIAPVSSVSQSADCVMEKSPTLIKEKQESKETPEVTTTFQIINEDKGEKAAPDVLIESAEEPN